MSDRFFLDRLERDTKGLAPDVRLAHPILLGSIEGADNVRNSLRIAYDTLGQEPASYLEFRDAGAAAVIWKCGPPDREIHGVTLALTNSGGSISELRIAVRPVQFLTSWRARLRARLPGAAGWELPGAARAGTFGPAEPLPFAVSDTAVFYAAALVRGVQGAAAVRHAAEQAKVVYGECEYGAVLRNGAHVLRAFTSKLPLGIVSLAHLDAHGRMDEASVFMQPWPGVMLFLERYRERLGSEFDASFYEVADSPARV